MSAAHFII